MKVKVDGGLCTGHGRCYSLAPEVFEADDEGYSELRDTMIDVPEGTRSAARHGARLSRKRDLGRRVVTSKLYALIPRRPRHRTPRHLARRGRRVTRTAARARAITSPGGGEQ